MSDENQPRWRGALAKAISTAAEDPDVFVENCKTLARKLGMSVEQVYRKLEDDPEFAMRELRNRAVQGLARKIKHELGL